MISNRTTRLVLACAAFVVALIAVPDLALAAGDGDFATTLEKGWLWAFLAAFGIGVATSLTPCVYPMIPIVLGVFGARDEGISRKKAFLLATMYVFGMATLFSGLGVVFALIGKKSGIGELLANPYVVIPMVALYVGLAISMFGFFELRLPTALQNRLNQVGGRGYGGAFGMGLVGGFTAAPCTGPFIATLLAWIATTGNVTVGGSVMFVYALGMGVLFWALAVFTLSLPRSGRWMEWVKSGGGIGLLVAALYFLRPIVPSIGKLTHPSVLFLVGAIVLAGAGIVLGAVHLSFHGTMTERVRKTATVAVAVVGLTGIVNWALTADRYLPWETDEAAAFAAAEASGKGVMLDFSAEWCVPCKQLEKNTFADGKVYDKVVESYIPLKIDVTENSDADEAIKDRYKAGNLPAVLFMTKDKVELGRVSSYIGPSDFIKAMDQAAKKRTTTASAP